MASRKGQMSQSSTSSDAELGSRLNSPDWGSALAILWDRHAGLLYSTARSLTRSDDDARDAMSDALAKIAQRASEGTLQIESSFKSYAVMVVRNACHDGWRRTGRVDVKDDVEVDSKSGTSFLPDPVLEDLDETYIAVAFARLPERYRQVLWLTEVESLPPREVADLLSMSANNVSQIAVRARAALREGWAAAHLTRVDVDPDCQEYVEMLPGFAAGTLTAARRTPLETHLASCVSCAALNNDLMNDTVKLRGLTLAIPIAVLFRHLRKVVGGAARSSTSSVGVFARAIETARTAVTAARITISSGQQVALIAVGGVATVATVTFGWLAISSFGNDSASDGGAPAVEVDESGSDTAMPGDQDPSSTEPARPITASPSSTVDTSVPSSTAPPTSAPPTETTVARVTIPPLRSPISTSPPTTGPSPVSTKNYEVFVADVDIPIGQTRSWSFQGVSGTSIVATTNHLLYDDFFFVPNYQLLIVSPSGQTRSCTFEYETCHLTETGTYEVRVTAQRHAFPAGAEVMISTNVVELKPNEIISLGEPLKAGHTRIWRFNGTKGQVFAMNFQDLTFDFMGTFGVSGPIEYTSPLATTSATDDDPPLYFENCVQGCVIPTTGVYNITLTAPNRYWWSEVFDASLQFGVSTATGTLEVDIPHTLSADIPAGFSKIFTFEANAGDPLLPAVAWHSTTGADGTPLRRNPTGYLPEIAIGYVNFDEELFERVTDFYEFGVLAERSGMHSVVFHATSRIPAGTKVIVADASGPVVVDSIMTMPDDRQEFGRAIWTYAGVTGDVVSAWSGPQTSLNFGPLSFPGTFTLGVVSRTGTHIVNAHVENEGSTMQWRLGTEVTDLEVGQKVSVLEEVSALGSKVWKFDGRAGDVLVTDGSIFRRERDHVLDFPKRYPLVSDFWNPGSQSTDCPCVITQPGEYFFKPAVLGAVGADLSVDILLEKIHFIERDQVITLTEEIPVGSRKLYYIDVGPPQSVFVGGLPPDPVPEVWLPDLEAEVMLWSVSDYECTPIAQPCILDQGFTHVLEIKAVTGPVPAGTEFVLSSSDPHE